jgi:heme/copper-type cytochrome/quinol oxidase subunit 3
VVTAVAGTLQLPTAPRRVNGRVPPPPPPPGDDGRPEGEEPARRPALDNLRVAMLFFIAAESMFFAALIAALFILRTGQPVWPPPFQPRLPVGITALNTVVLLGSSVAMLGATRGLARGDRRRLVRGLGLAAALGGLFLAVQGLEWVRLIGFGLTLTSGTYGATFYTLIGTHALHVLGALGWLAVTLALARRGRFTTAHAAPVKACALYWHFVVGLWPILYVTVYLL